ncbi:class I SAM-dependent methyltransferase [Microbulbifer flavimaris]|uniref:Class I SAM-dependent methyltransferase n=1 Tax=Microbulbifer flavimaris TaxID=1781068 RepID=A0ABX4HW41_9GAMM|nr:MULTISPECIES: class I SAM-dependent methyltransferase [Microbulbifer]KUJ80225.1 methyltransferase [Microbulbifer sp. ZGT114]PCO04291.1 class I SAM-dependent methyltransferase [Microbulbifer flavimaris]
MSVLCPLCRHPAAQPYHHDQSRDYLQCAHCALVFVPAQFHLSAEQERAFYDLHENDLADSGYRRFLNRCAEPLLQRLPAVSEGLDFGCGPAPLLAQMLEDAGHRVWLYDPFYAAEKSALRRDYDFIVTTEVVEHLAAPGVELEALWALLRPGGLLAVMTKRVMSPERFAGWHYIRDPTHICFFSDDTFRWLAKHLGARLELAGPDLVFLQKSGVDAK